MDTKTLGLLAKYNSHANTEMNACPFWCSHEILQYDTW